MTRELNQLLKKLKSLSPDDIARVEQFVTQLKTPDPRGLTVALRAVPIDARPADSTPTGSIPTDRIPADRSPADTHCAEVKAAVAAPAAPTLPVCDDVEAAHAAHAASAQWRRRPFQTIDAVDLQPIAALFREAVDSRAASRIRFGSR